MEKPHKTIPSSATVPMTHRRALASFTLIELLVVIAIILILAGISLKVMGMVNRKTATARTLMVLEQVKGALGAYYTAYGSYPNANGVASTAPYVLPSTIPAGLSSNWSKGVTAYIMSAKKYFPESQPAISFFNDEASRWDYYFDKLGAFIHTATPTNPPMASGGSMYLSTNATLTIRDGWGRDIFYSLITANNQEGYWLWSAGADGINSNGLGDDILVTFQ